MTEVPPRIPVLHDGVAERLARAGRSSAAIEALLAADQGLLVWRRMLIKGELVADVLAALGGAVEVAEFGALAAVGRIIHGLDRRAPGEATVGALAQEMGIDPSRASRLAGQLIAKGFLRRDVAQSDARKAILVPTAAAVALMSAFRDRKWDRYEEIFADWSDDDLVVFARLLARYLAAERGAVARGATPPAA
ncbi:MAG: MarR family transcriptional regulator [Rubellimicrobium sp.]|nr:MarR family transcriptional regulator [Rubellimicrobium sp.]